MDAYGVLVISHGSRDELWVTLVDNAVADISMKRDMPIESSFLEIVEGRLIQDGVNRLREQGVTNLIVVPLFVSSGSTHVDEIAWAFGLKAEPATDTELDRIELGGMRVHWCEPMDDDPEIARMLWASIEPLSAAPEREIVLVVGHGAAEGEFHRKWQRGLESVARQVRELGRFAGSEYAMLLPDQAAMKMERIRAAWPEHDVIVAPLFLSEGYFTGTVIPRRFDGYSYKYNGKAMLPNPLVTRWMERRIGQALRGAGR